VSRGVTAVIGNYDDLDLVSADLSSNRANAPTDGAGLVVGGYQYGDASGSSVAQPAAGLSIEERCDRECEEIQRE
jgi:hypothetical protein